MYEMLAKVAGSEIVMLIKSDVNCWEPQADIQPIFKAAETL